MATKTRKAKQLTATWEPATLPGPLRGLLQLDDGKTAPLYAVCLVAGDAPVCCEVQKLDGSDPYMVKLTHGGQPISCDCWGALRHGRCKHLSELGALVAKGEL